MCSRISAFPRQQPIMFRSPRLTPPVTNPFTLIRSTAATPQIPARSLLTRSTSPQPQLRLPSKPFIGQFRLASAVPGARALWPIQSWSLSPGSSSVAFFDSVSYIFSQTGVSRLSRLPKHENPVSCRHSAESWLRGRDLNPRPSGYEPDELPGCSTPRREIYYVRSSFKAQSKTSLPPRD
jgi:hypothetical protein